jgi:teichuronic acid exporter
VSSLKQKSVSGVVWSVTQQFGIYGARLVLGVILARLLTPEDFGLIGMIMVFFAIAEVFVDSGFGAAYIQKKETNEIDADTVFYTNLGISILLYAILFFGAPLIAKFYEQEKLIDLTRVMALLVVINAFNIIQQSQIVRDVNFKKLTKISVIATLLSGAVGITSAYYGFGVWALVFQSLCNRIIMTISFWITSAYRPKRQFSRKSFMTMFSFGSWVLITGIIQRVFDNIYLLVIGKYFSTIQLGYYVKATQFQQLASVNIMGAIGSVSFPIFSKLQDDKERLINGMQMYLQHSMFFMLPILLCLIIVAEPFVILLLTEKWAPMIPYLQLLCLGAIFYPIHMINVQSLTAQGYSQLSFRLDVIKNSLRLLNIIVAYRYGVIYIIFGEVILSIIALWINTWYINKFIGYGLAKQIKDLGMILLSGSIATLLAYYLTRYIFNDLTLIFISSIIMYLGFYFVMNYIINKKMLYSNIQILRGLLFSK